MQSTPPSTAPSTASESVIGPYSTVLVALIKEPRDLDIARQQHWYRIPVHRLPARAARAQVIAFYQPRSFGEERWAIRYYAPVRCWSQVQRLELFPEEPNHPRAREPYYQIWLGDLQPLPHPIASRRWRRLTFIVTHWERLLQVEAVEELLHGTIWEQYLWRAMRNLGYLAEHLLCEVRARFRVTDQR